MDEPISVIAFWGGLLAAVGAALTFLIQAGVKILVQYLKKRGEVAESSLEGEARRNELTIEAQEIMQNLAKASLDDYRQRLEKYEEQSAEDRLVINELKTQLDHSREEREAARLQLQATTKELEESRIELLRIKEEMVETQQKLAKAQDEVRQLSLHVERMQIQLDATQKQVTALETQLLQERQRNVELNQQLNDALQKLAAAQTMLDTERDKARALQAQIQQLQTQLESIT